MRKAFLPLALAASSAAWAASSCASLTSLSFIEITITSAQNVPAGMFTPPASGDAPGKPFSVMAFCRVVAVAKPTSDSLINFEVWIPPVSAWNGKFQGVGNGGYAGVISYTAMADALARGYATAGSDTGHSGGELIFADRHPEKAVDWAQRALHVTTTAAKLILRNYQGRFPQRSYFVGCSTGGMQALSEAQRFPADYDGIVAGDPGYDRTHLNAEFLWTYKAIHENEASYIPSSLLPMIHKAVMAACDAVDGIADGIISDPRRCHFDPETIVCRGKPDGNCLTEAQAEAVRKIYAGPRNPRTGERIGAGYEPGSESPANDTQERGWDAYITGLKEPMRLDFWKYWVFHDPNWDWHTFDFDRDLAYADEKMAAVNSNSPDLRAFKARGGKLLMYHGWADPVGAPGDTIDYYEKVASLMGGPGQTEGFFRLFMVPGMAHCRNGPGPLPSVFSTAGNTGTAVKRDAEHDMLAALDRWVEHGVAPEHIIASHVTNGIVDRTRPLCPYPQIAHWKGTGSTDDAANFQCGVESH